MILYENRIASSFQAVDEAVHEIIDALKAQNPQKPMFELDNHKLFKISFMLREILNNAVEHGNHFDLEKLVTCRVYSDPLGLVFEVSDEGKGIDLRTQSTEQNDDILLRERHRGYQTILEMAFKLNIVANQVTVTLELNQEA